MLSSSAGSKRTAVWFSMSKSSTSSAQPATAIPALIASIRGELKAPAGWLHDKLGWIGRLPGDIRIERDNYRVYIPITTMIIASVLLTLILRLIRWLMR